MKLKAFIIATIVLLAGPVLSAQDNVLSKLEEYLCEVDKLPIEQANAETDFIISSVLDTNLRAQVAEKVFFHFMESDYMGSENTAVHVFDKWFADYTILFDDIDDFENARVYAFLNRASLIGEKARELSFIDIEGESVSLPKKGRRCIVYFYSTECPKCLALSKCLSSYLNGKHPSLNFYAVCIDSDPSSVAEYCRKHLQIKDCCRTRTHFLYTERSEDTDLEFVTAYGVAAAPCLFYIDRKSIIRGRKLNCAALEKVVE